MMQLFLPPDQRELLIGGGATVWNYGAYSAEIRVVGENGLVDINRADRQLLRNVLEQLGILDEDAETATTEDRIEDFSGPG
ncbi:MAG: hypothetical protein R3E89_13220 [Thiolinea sp.]